MTEYKKSNNTGSTDRQCQPTSHKYIHVPIFYILQFSIKELNEIAPINMSCKNGQCMMNRQM